MSADTAYDKDLLEFLKTKASNRRGHCVLNSKLAETFNKQCKYKRTFTTFRNRANLLFSTLHEINLDILSKVEMLYVFERKLSEEMKRELAQFPPYHYTLNANGKIVRFDSGNGTLLITEEDGKQCNRRVAEDLGDNGEPAPKRVKEEVVEELEQEANRGEIDHEALRSGSPHDQNGHRTEGVQARVGENLNNVQVIAPPEFEPQQEEQPPAPTRASEPARVAVVPVSSISASQLANGIAGMMYNLKSVEWYNKASERIKILSEKQQTVPLEDFSEILSIILAKIDTGKMVEDRHESVHVMYCLNALQALVFPLGVQLMASELEKIDKEKEKIEKMEKKAKQRGEAVETWFIPKEVFDFCIRNLIRLTLIE